MDFLIPIIGCVLLWLQYRYRKALQDAEEVENRRKKRSSGAQEYV
jgi:hypothetical protein